MTPSRIERTHQHRLDGPAGQLMACSSTSSNSPVSGGPLLQRSVFSAAVSFRSFGPVEVPWHSRSPRPPGDSATKGALHERTAPDLQAPAASMCRRRRSFHILPAPEDVGAALKSEFALLQHQERRLHPSRSHLAPRRMAGSRAPALHYVGKRLHWALKPPIPNGVIRLRAAGKHRERVAPRMIAAASPTALLPVAQASLHSCSGHQAENDGGHPEAMSQSASDEDG